MRIMTGFIYVCIYIYLYYTCIYNTIYVYMFYVYIFFGSRLEKQQRSGEQLSERLVSLSIMGAQLKAPETLEHHATVVLRCSRGAHYTKRRELHGQPR